MSALEILAGELAEMIAPLVAAELAATSPAPAAGDAWRLLSLVEVCDVLGRSARTVRKWVATGDLVTVRLDGGDLRFDLDDVKAFAKARRVGLGVLAERWQPSRKAALAQGLRGTRQAGNPRVEA